MATKQPTQQQKIQAHLVKVFDGMFASDTFDNHRNRIFYRVANYASPTTGKLVSEVLDQDEIGEVINQLDTIAFNKRLNAKVSRLEDKDLF